MNILVIDDDATIVNGIVQILENHFSGALEIRTAFDGRQALSMLTEQYFPIIISDIKMPNLSGIEFLSLLRKEHIESTVIMLSGYDDYPYIHAALKLDVYDYLLKPIHIEHFTEVIGNAMKESILNGTLLPTSYAQNFPVQPINSSPYFNLIPQAPFWNCTQLQEQLFELQTLLFNMDTEHLPQKLDDIFLHLSSEQIDEPTLKKTLINFQYDLMKNNNALIPIIAECKLTDKDLAAQIKNQPQLSQLKEKFSEILSFYIEKLRSLQNKNNAFIVKKAVEFIEQHYMEPISLNDIAAQFHLHPNYFSNLFKSRMNTTIRDYLLNYRIQKAKELIADKNMKLYDIAFAVGYQDPAHFNRAFKNVCGISPSQYRKLCN